MGQDPETTTLRVPGSSRSRARTIRHSPVQHAALLVVLVGPDAGKRITVGDGVIIGRDVDGRGLVVDDGVSRRHLRVSRQTDGSHLVEDLGSRNGTYVNGQRVEAAPLQSGDKVAVGTGTVLLFTRHDRYEEQVLRAQKMQALGQLAGGAAHDFNNLVLAILGNVDYLKTREQAPPPDISECLAEIETAARRAAQLTRQLLSFARKREAAMEPVDIPALIQEANGLLRRSLARNVSVTTDVEAGLGVVGDSAQLLQVLINAGINAGQAMPGGGELTIEAKLRSMHEQPLPPGLSPGRYVAITLRDNGQGMNADTLARAFQPFFSTKPEGEGTGLGLSTAQSVVRDHGGEIEIRSRVGDGTQVSVYLPAVEPSRSLQAASEQTPIPVSGAILVVDDEVLVRSTSRRLLERFGLDVVTAADAADALRVLEQRVVEIDVVILSDDLPDGSLETLLPQFIERAPQARIVVATSKTDPDRGKTLQRLGAHGLLRKPWGARTLWSRVVGVLQRGDDP